MASLSSTKTSLFASETHLLTGVHVTSYLNLFAVKFLILTFSRLENHFSIITLFFSFFNNNIFLPQFLFVLCKQLNLPNLSTSSNSHFGPLSKLPFPRNFNFTLLGNYIWLLNFLVYPSCTAIDKYCLWKTAREFKEGRKEGKRRRYLLNSNFFLGFNDHSVS